MSLHEIKEQIAKESHKKAQSIEDDAKSEGSKVLAEARSKASIILEQSKKEIAAKVEAIRREHRAGIEIERHNSILLAKEHVVDSQMGQVKGAIQARIMKSNYEKMVRQVVTNAKELIQGELVIKADKEGQAILKKMGYKAELGAKGVVIQNRDGTIKIDASLESTINNHIEMIRSRISENLFIEDKKPAAKVAKHPKAKAKKVPKPKKAAKKSKKTKRK